MRLIYILPALLLTLQASAGEGMWLPHLLKALNESEMKSMGMKLKAEDIYSVNKGSLKDAIVHFGGFCTAEVISSQGLLLTNHHCGYDNIQSHSSLEKNYLRDGYWAKNTTEELTNPGLFARFIEEIADVSTDVLKGVTPGMSAAEKQSVIDINIRNYKSKFTLDKFHELEVRPFFAGNQYLAFFMVRYNDVRLVGTPPESIGKFGADTDNWVWPRHTGDFSLFRIYAGPNNEPADISENNKPFTPKHSMPISLDGIQEGDFTMVFGFPGRTDEYLPSIAVDQIMTHSDPAKIAVRDAALNIMNKYMRNDESTRLKYASKYATIANSWKKWIGEAKGLKSTNAVGKKKTFEAEFEKRAMKAKQYTGLIPQFNALYTANLEASLVRDYFSEAPNRNIEMLRLMGSLRNLVQTYEKSGEKDYLKMKDRLSAFMQEFYQDFSADIDKEIFVSLMQICRDNLAKKYMPASTEGKSFEVLGDVLYGASPFTSWEKSSAVLGKSPQECIDIIKNDPMYQMAMEWNEIIRLNVNPEFEKNRRQIDSLQSIYMKAQMELFPEKKFYPDANSTLRVTYGKVQGYKPKDAVYYNPVTYLDGVMEKYVPGDYEFDVSQKLIQLHEDKDYGPYADKTGKLPVCFLGSNHTTGGNSGSPAIDAHGNLIGLNFDRVWEGTMSDINYDASICRNIMVDARYVLFVIDKFAGAKRLIDEMKLVHPKGKKMKKKVK
ncbi:MAG: S46 family peptidase [Saprospiraceae bacterium]|nr:S46 family peptidase [Saprospiraceae bacterium]